MENAEICLRNKTLPSMTEKFTRIITSSVDGTLECQCGDILGRIGNEYVPVSIVFFFGIAGTEAYLSCDTVLRSMAAASLPECPLVSLVAQRPMDGRLVAEVLYLKGESEIERHPDYLVLRSGECSELLTQGIGFPSCGDTGEQSRKVFARIGEILDAEHFAVSQIVRQWNYIERITSVDEGIQNYQLFNDARSGFYSGTDWSDDYPAATGIGCDAGGVSVSVYAVKGFEGVSKPVDNPLQIPAHRYSEKVLASGKESVRTTPKFERGRLLGNVMFVSGTAAIRGENCEFSEDPEAQAHGAIDVVERLVAPANIASGCESFEFEMIRVYVRRPEDLECVKAVFSDHFSGVPTHFLVADVCRPELLLELEGVGRIVGTA